jgi:hypothetical protein
VTMPCSVASSAAHEPLVATAPLARCWIVIEQPGPWGRSALTDSHFEPELGALLATKADATGVTVLLARHPERQERRWDPSDRRAWIAVTAPGGMRLREGVLPDPSILSDWDFPSMAGGHLPAFGQRTSEPLLLICTHSGRDACCAVHGRALIDAMPTSPRTWECSHLGGHRFAPTALSLPDGYAYGRLDAEVTQCVVDEAGARHMVLSAARGRSYFPPPLQAADLAVRAAINETAAADLDVLRIVGDRAVPVSVGAASDDDEVLCEVRHVDGRAWSVRVRRDATGAVRKESCLGEPHAVLAWTVVSLTGTNPWLIPPGTSKAQSAE